MESFTPLSSAYIKTPEFSSNFISQPSKLIKGEEEYKVNTIHAHRGSPSRWQYLISWKGYSHAGDIWKPESHLGHACFILQAYNFLDPRIFLWLPPFNCHHSHFPWSPYCFPILHLPSHLSPHLSNQSSHFAWYYIVAISPTPQSPPSPSSCCESSVADKPPSQTFSPLARLAGHWKVICNDTHQT